MLIYLDVFSETPEETYLSLSELGFPLFNFGDMLPLFSGLLSFTTLNESIVLGSLS